jgi:hypothetical protein
MTGVPLAEATVRQPLMGLRHRARLPACPHILAALPAACAGARHALLRRTGARVAAPVAPAAAGSGQAGDPLAALAA